MISIDKYLEQKDRFEAKPEPDAYAVISKPGCIEYSVSCHHQFSADYARQLCHEHINECAGDSVEGAGQWVVRPIRVIQEVT